MEEYKARKEKEELAEKRRVAPGWLDSGVHILKPENVKEEEAVQAQAQGLLDDGVPGRGLPGQSQSGQGAGERNREAEELDRVFGGLSVNQ